jgi:Holliday junction DNA helicase RuvA
MFNSLTGQITYKDQSRVFLQTGSVEWELAISRNSSESLPDQGEQVRLFAYLHHREDQMKLFGFHQASERDLFLDLLRVEGIGPRQALKILSGIEVHRFVEALEAEDLELLSSVPGVGQKTAQKILLKLRGRLTVSTPAGASLEEDLVNALVGMGFERRAARAAVSSATKALRDSDLSREELERELFRAAIGQLSSQERRG